MDSASLGFPGSRMAQAGRIITVCLTIFMGACAGLPVESDELRETEELNRQVVQLYNQGRYADAIPLAERALAIREKALGPEHPDVATSLSSLAELYRATGAYAKAELLHTRALAIDEKAYGPNHPEVAADLNNLAVLYKATGAYAKAEPLYTRSLTILEKALGPDHPNVAASLNNLAQLYQATGAYAKAEPLHTRSLAIREKALGPDHRDVATSLSSLAVLYDASGAYDKAEPLYTRSLAIWEKALGPDHPDVGTSLNNLAGLYQNTGAHAKAEPLYARALAIYEKALGPEHPDVATSLNNLADLYRATGAYAKAEPLFTRALAIYEKALGPEHPDVATSLNNLAALSRADGDYTTAESLYERALAIREKAFGPDHADVADSVNGLARLYEALSDYAKAEPLYTRSLAIREKALGPEHPDVAESLNNLAGLYLNTGAYAKAEPLYTRALAIYEKALGPTHPHVATILNNLAVLSAGQGDFGRTLRFTARAQEIDNVLIEQFLGAAAEERKTQFLATKDATLHSFLSLITQHFPQDPAALQMVLNHWLVRKGAILEAQKRAQEAMALSDDPAVAQALQALARIRAQLSQLAFAGRGKEGPAVYRERRDALQQEKVALEEQLVKLSQAYAVNKRVRQADAGQVAQGLPPGTVLLDFARVTPFDHQAKGQTPKWQPARYLAFVLPAGGADRIRLVELGEAAPIEQSVEALRKEIAGGQDPRGERITRLTQQVHDLVFAPLKPFLGPAKELFISPDGLLSLVPFEILQSPDGKFLIEEYLFNYLAAGRDLLAFRATLGQPGKGLLLGDPDFDLSPSEKAGTLRQLALAASAEPTAPRTRSGEMRNLAFTRLPGSGREVRAIQALLGEAAADLHTGKEALEEVLRQRAAPRILHLATHGFFLSDQDLGPLPDDPFRGGDLERPAARPRSSGSARPLEDPFLRSGFALAGANQALRAEDPERSDGIVTAEKVLGLRLQGTELVVLSACDTGVGAVKSGEGVYGLRRAFTLAGAKSLVMSLWSVPDRETQELMVQFYRNLLSGTLSRAQALRQAALTQMQVVKERYGAPHPFFWGAFVFLGEP